MHVRRDGLLELRVRKDSAIRAMARMEVAHGPCRQVKLGSGVGCHAALLRWGTTLDDPVAGKPKVDAAICYYSGEGQPESVIGRSHAGLFGPLRNLQRVASDGEHTA